MPCRLIDLSSPPYDEQSVHDAYAQSACPGVKAIFDANPIGPGNCIVIDGKGYRILGVRVKCDGNTVFENGAPSPAPPPTQIHGYVTVGVQIEFWLEEISESELEACEAGN